MICKKAYEEVKEKIKDYDHITGECTHQVCDLNLSLSKKISILRFIIWKIIIHILLYGKYNFKTSVIPKTIEKYMSFIILKPKNKDIKDTLKVWLW